MVYPTVMRVIQLVGFVQLFLSTRSVYGCPFGSLLYEDVCLYTGDSARSHSSAEQACRGGGGSLAIIKSAAMMDHIINYLTTNENLWIGLQYTDGRSLWSDGSTLQPGDFTYWEDGAVTDQHCTVLRGIERTWNTEPCHNTMGYLCQTFVPTISSDGVSTSCIHRDDEVEVDCGYSRVLIVTSAWIVPTVHTADSSASTRCVLGDVPVRDNQTHCGKSQLHLQGKYCTGRQHCRMGVARSSKVGCEGWALLTTHTCISVNAGLLVNTTHQYDGQQYGGWLSNWVDKRQQARIRRSDPPEVDTDSINWYQFSVKTTDSTNDSVNSQHINTVSVYNMDFLMEDAIHYVCPEFNTGYRVQDTSCDYCDEDTSGVNVCGYDPAQTHRQELTVGFHDYPMSVDFPIIMAYAYHNSAASTCNFISRRNHCYTVHARTRTWQQARAYCELQGGELVSVADVEEDFIVQLVAAGALRHTAASLWVGANYTSDGRWTWLTGEPVSPVMTLHMTHRGRCVSYSPADHLYISSECDRYLPTLCKTDLTHENASKEEEEEEEEASEEDNTTDTIRMITLVVVGVIVVLMLVVVILICVYKMYYRGRRGDMRRSLSVHTTMTSLPPSTPASPTYLHPDVVPSALRLPPPAHPARPAPHPHLQLQPLPDVPAATTKQNAGAPTDGRVPTDDWRYTDEPTTPTSLHHQQQRQEHPHGGDSPTPVSYAVIRDSQLSGAPPPEGEDNQYEYVDNVRPPTPPTATPTHQENVRGVVDDVSGTSASSYLTVVDDDAADGAGGSSQSREETKPIRSECVDELGYLKPVN